MSRVTVTIDRLVLSGIDAVDQHALVDALRHELTRALAAPGGPNFERGSRSIAQVRRGGLKLEPGRSGARKLGAETARAIVKGARQ
jgi:hypothetical protein